jgi:succinate-acetate transporter protein
VRFVGPLLPTATAHQATGVFLMSWLIFTFYMTFAALRVNLAVTAVFVFLTLTYLFLTIGALVPNTTMTKVGGGLGLATAACAWYASFAGVMNGTWKRNIIPTWPTGVGAISAPARPAAAPATPGAS